MKHCRTLGELITELMTTKQLTDTPLAALYDHGADVKFGVTVQGMHECDAECEPPCSMVGHLVLDIDPRDDPR